MEHDTSTAPGDHGVATIIAALEEQLVALDRIGSRLAGAHLDAAIQQLRIEIARQTLFDSDNSQGNQGT